MTRAHVTFWGTVQGDDFRYTCRSYAVVPGDQLRIEVSTIKLMAKAGFLKTEAYVKDN